MPRLPHALLTTESPTPYSGLARGGCLCNTLVNQREKAFEDFGVGQSGRRVLRSESPHPIEPGWDGGASSDSRIPRDCHGLAGARSTAASLPHLVNPPALGKQRIGVQHFANFLAIVVYHEVQV